MLTESAAILVWLGDRHPQAGLAPPLDHPLRGQYLRWMSYVATQIYALFWVRDEPSRLVPDTAAQPALLARSEERIAHCWRLMDTQMRGITPAGALYLLGDRIGMLDLYVTVASRWTPRRTRFAQEAPHLMAVARRVDADPRLQAFWAARFPFTADDAVSD